MRRKRRTFAEVRAEGYERGVTHGESLMYERIKNGWKPGFLWLTAHNLLIQFNQMLYEQIYPKSSDHGEITGVKFIVEEPKK